MSDTDQDGGRRPPEDEAGDGEPIRELADFGVEVRSGFLPRVRRRVERRVAVTQALSASWHVPAAILLEFLSMVFGLLGFGEDRKGGSQ